MAKSTVGTSDAQTKKAWEEKVFREVEKEAYFKKFMGSGIDSIVQVKTNVEKDQGDEITFTYVKKLAGAGVTEGQTLEGNEEKLSTHTKKLALSQYRHGVRDDGAMSRKRPIWDMDQESKQALQVWAREKIDSLAFTAIQTSPTKLFYFDSSGVMTVGTKANLAADADCKLTLNSISALKTWALTGGGRAYDPLRPVRVDGQDHLVLLTHPDVLFDLKSTDAYQAANREAMEKGKSNPLFTGASLVWDNVIVHTHENMNIGTDGGGASVAWGQGILLGAQALLWAWGQRGEMVEKSFDYGNEHGYAYNIICGVTKPVFNSKDFGSIGVVYHRTNVSGL